jgi:hypothetical protein
MTHKNGLSHVMCGRPFCVWSVWSVWRPRNSHTCLLNTTVGHRFCFYMERIGRNCLFAVGLDVDSQGHPFSAKHARYARYGASPI